MGSGREGSGGDTALTALYHRALPQVYGYLLPRCGSAVLAEDLTADTFMAAVVAARLDHPSDRTVGWLVGVARHKLVDHWRRIDLEHRKFGVADSDAKPAQDPWDAQLDVVAAHAGLSRQPAHHRAALPGHPHTEGAPMATVSIRYIVNDVDTAIDFYTTHLQFELQMHPNDLFAMLGRGDLRLVLVKPTGPHGPAGGGAPMPDGRMQEPGGWNRFSVEVPDLAAAVSKLRGSGARFRNDIVTGVGGKQIIVEDPSGNPVELFEPIVPEARLTQPAP